MNYSIAIMMPALNEEDNLSNAVDAIFEANKEFNYEIKLLIVNDGSSDATGEIAEKIARSRKNIEVVHNKFVRGLGTAFTMGIFLLSGDYYGYIPSDNQISKEYIVALFKRIGDADLILSYPGNAYVRHKHRRVISKLFVGIYNFLFGLDLHYYNGPAFFRMTYLKEMDIPTKFFSYHAETVLRFIKYGYSYIEVPCQLGERMYGKSTALRWNNVIGIFMGTFFVFMDIYLLRRNLYQGRGRKSDATCATKAL